MRTDVECNNVYIFAEDKDRTGGKNILTNRQTEKASKQDEQTDNHLNQQRNQSETGGKEGC